MLARPRPGRWRGAGSRRIIERQGEAACRRLLSAPTCSCPAPPSASRGSRRAVPLAIASGARRDEIELVLRRARPRRAVRRHRRRRRDAAQQAATRIPYPRAVAAARRARAHPGVARPRRACVAIEDSHWGLASAQAGRACAASASRRPIRAHELVAADLVVDSLDELTIELPARNGRPARDHRRTCCARSPTPRSAATRATSCAARCCLPLHRVPRGRRRGRARSQLTRLGAIATARVERLGLEAVAAGAGRRAEPAAVRRRGLPRQRRAVRGPAQQLPQRRRRAAQGPAHRAVRGLPRRGAPRGRPHRGRELPRALPRALPHERAPPRSPARPRRRSLPRRRGPRRGRPAARCCGVTPATRRPTTGACCTAPRAPRS